VSELAARRRQNPQPRTAAVRWRFPRNSYLYQSQLSQLAQISGAFAKSVFPASSFHFPASLVAASAALWLFLAATLAAGAAPVISPIGNVTVPAGKSLIIPITATVTNGRALTYTITGSTNAMAIVLHTNNPFWKLNVAQACATNAPGAFQTPFRGGLATVTNVGDLTFMLFPEYAPNTVAIFQGLSASGFYNSNTIFHRVVTNFVIQGGDPLANGAGGLVFQYNDEFNPQAIFSGNGQLALANSGPNTDGSQFFVTVGQQRALDLKYTLFGQLLRGFNVLTNINSTAVDTNSRPLANEIITLASFVPDTVDTVITLTATNRARITNTVTVVANDRAGGLATNTFKAVTVTDTNSNNQPFLYGNTVTNLVAPMHKTLTNVINAVELDGQTLYWWPLYADANSQTNATISPPAYSNYNLRTLTYNETNSDGQVKFILTPTNNYAGPVTVYFFVSPISAWETYYFDGFGSDFPYADMAYTFVFGDTPIAAQAAAVTPLLPGAFTNLLLATFTNGVAGSAITNFTASIQWGDDSITAGAITTNTAKMKQVFGSHTYTNSGMYPVYVTIQSGLGVTTEVSNTITVVPALSLARLGTNNLIGWPAWAFGYAVQSSSNLAGTNWVTVTNVAALVGFQNVITNAAVSNTPPASPVFYRLNNKY
jgi:cyclophilin family peptidyl-prolyl cis-trans isomerase